MVWHTKKILQMKGLNTKFQWFYHWWLYEPETQDTLSNIHSKTLKVCIMIVLKSLVYGKILSEMEIKLNFVATMCESL